MLADAASATRPTATSLGLAALGPEDYYTKPAVIASLAEKVKSLQRDFPHIRERWAEHCGTYSTGIKDPHRHDVPSLRAFLDLHARSCGKFDYCNLRDDNYCGGCGSSLP